MIRLLGRATSGNVQKVMFLLEEIGLAYSREDYGRQFGNTNTDDYRKLNPTMKVPTLIDGDVVIWESNSIMRYLAALHAPQLTGATPAERTYVERWMDWLLAAANPPYLAVFKDAKNRDGAWKFMSWAMEPEPHYMYSKGLGLLPARKTVADRPEFTRDAALAGFIKSFPFSIVSPYLAYAGWGGKLDSEGVPLFQQALVGKLSSKEFLDKFAEVLTKNMS
jgi:glutathione S-transferase